MTQEKTTSQVVVKTGYVPGKRPITYDKVRYMRRDPTISLVRLLFFAGVLAGDWSVVSDNDDPDLAEAVELARKYIERQLMPLREHLLEKAALGCYDFGWQPFEKIFDIVNGEFTLLKLKPLLQDKTEIVVDENNGSFEGLKQGDIELSIPESLLYNFNVEGTDWYGASIMANMEWPYDATIALEQSARRFDKKMAGAHWFLKYPNTTSTFNGVDTPNSEIANKILDSLESSGKIAVPRAKKLFSEASGVDNPEDWDLSLIAAPGAQFPFADRFHYLDTLKARGGGFPERAVLEGQYGTKAEAQAHGDFALTIIEFRHGEIVKMTNWHLVNHMLRFQVGQQFENKVKIKVAPLSDQKRAMLVQVYTSVLSNPDGFIRVIDKLDLDAIQESIGIPTVKEEKKDELPTVVPEVVPAGVSTGTN